MTNLPSRSSPIFRALLAPRPAPVANAIAAPTIAPGHRGPGSAVGIPPWAASAVAQSGSLLPPPPTFSRSICHRTVQFVTPPLYPTHNLPQTEHVISSSAVLFHEPSLHHPGPTNPTIPWYFAEVFFTTTIASPFQIAGRSPSA